MKNKQCVFFRVPFRFLILFLLFFLMIPSLYAFQHINIAGKRYIRYEGSDLSLILTESLSIEGCYKCHLDMYPDLAYDPNDPESPNCFCFFSNEVLPYPIDYYSNYNPDPNFPSVDYSANYKEKYEERKKGHLSHLVYQPFGLGRRCLDCHDPVSYKLEDPNIPHPSDGNVYFKDGNTLKSTIICSRCHGGFYPEGSTASDPNIISLDPKIADPNYMDPNSVRILQWGDPGTVTCLQCHDNSYENGGVYASYISRYSSDPNVPAPKNHPPYYHDWSYKECLIEAPDPDKVPGQNYWSKNGHGVLYNTNYAGAVQDIGYPDPNRPLKVFPNKGAMNSRNIPVNTRHRQSHDLDLDPNDGMKNFCWECHWSNITVKNKVCAKSSEYPSGIPIGKYNGHLDTIDYRDERWGDPNEKSTAPHHQWKECRECHTKKYSHFVYKSPWEGRDDLPPSQRYSHCIVCHNPHGSGDEYGNANLFMIKGRIYKDDCNNCHFSQFKTAPCSPYPPPDKLGSPHPELADTWFVDFRDTFNLDKREDVSSINSPEIPGNTTDICEVCHQTRKRELWTTPGELKGINATGHQNGAMHYFIPENNTNISMIDYRGTDCTGCHIHDPGPGPESEFDLEDSRSIFNSKAFAPTCRCHGIGRIDIGKLDSENYWGDSSMPGISGKGHGIPPPPSPTGSTEDDPHMAHARYNFSCRRCHIDNPDAFYDAYYVFKLDSDVTVGFDKELNPEGFIQDSGDIVTCSSLYCHSNGKGGYAEPITWSVSDLFCRDPDPGICDETDYVCNKCHKNPPKVPSGTQPQVPSDDVITDHSPCSETRCSTCHPHNGKFEAGAGFYKHVNGTVDILDDMYTLSDTKGCRCCHFDLDPNFHPTDFIEPDDCKTCHDGHKQNYVTDESLCKKCHSDPKVILDHQVIYVHNKFDLPGNPKCTDCHSGFHNVEQATYFAGQTDQEIEAKCVMCHDFVSSGRIRRFLVDTVKHKATDNCLKCHDVLNEDTSQNYRTFKTYTGEKEEEHYDPRDQNMPLRLGNMERSWTNQDNIPGNDCSVCHGQDIISPINSNVRIHDYIRPPHCQLQACPSCQDCHGDHKESVAASFQVEPGKGSCGYCHPDVSIQDGENLHSTIQNIPCNDCHGSHKTAATLNKFWEDSSKCEICHDSPVGITVVCNGAPVSGVHPPEASNCKACHLGIDPDGSNVKVEHYKSTAPPSVIKSWTGENSCGVCHTDAGIVKCGGIPSTIHATLGTNSDCSLCHANHCDMVYWDNPAKCIACHSPNPPICDICGPGSITSHYAFDTIGSNQALIQDCLSCHVEPVGGGEGNPLQHIDNPQTFVREGACLGCHSLARVRHGPTNSLGCYTCHPTHCLTQYGRNEACIWCHTTNPPIVDICQAGLGVTTHMALDSSIFNQIQVTNCIGCHVEPVTGGEANPINHINDPMTYVNPLTCIGCHSVVVPHGMSGLPWEGGLWPAVNCYSCHPKHCFSIYCDNQACIWCHTATPVLKNVCGLPSNIPHTGDCLNCHAAGVLTGGECNPADHMNGLTYVREGTCIGCHASVTLTHSPGTEACMLCHPVHCSFTYCSERQCKLCHNQPVFETISDYQCGIGLHKAPAYKQCNRCHIGECDPRNHKLGPLDIGLPTDLSGMQLNWSDCGLCHVEAKQYHAPCNAPCNLCHKGTGVHVCGDLDYCAENKCKCCHTSATFEIKSDYGCGIGLHDSTAYINCTLCHINECGQLNHMDAVTDVSNMPLDWATCGLCHKDAQAVHIQCNQPCTKCHSGKGNHACLDLNYCSETQCKCCHTQSVFQINSDYGCGTGIHSALAYVDCTICHIGECLAINHIDTKTDVSNMPLDWATCGLCHVDAQASHVNCPETCTTCHSGKSNHSCLELNYCAETKCKCCHILDTFQITSDYGCGTGTHPASAYVDCTMCHVGECFATNHLDNLTDVSNMPLNWTACGLCHVDAQAIHVNCPETCTTCHSGKSNHSCLELNYCAEAKCKCCHILDTFQITSDYGCGIGTHPASAYVDCIMCHKGECLASNHLDTLTDVSNMPLAWTACGLCHVAAQASHINCPEPCTLCHSGTSPHACTDLDYCADQKCRCCHINVPYHLGTPCDCSTCHSAECDPLEHDITGASTVHPMNSIYYNYTGTSANVGCNCCHGYPPQCVCVGISDTQDHCLDLVNGCSQQIYECTLCHTLFNSLPNHIQIIYADPAIVASCACHGDFFINSGAHAKHLVTPVMAPVYGTGNVIDCKACHTSTTNLAAHVVCIPGTGLTAPVVFDATLPMIGLIDSYTAGATPGTGTCNIYCHSDGEVDPIDTIGTYNYFLGAPPLWNQTTGIFSCGNAVLGTTVDPIYQCHGYPPTITHPGGAGGGGGAQNCINCHPTPLLGTLPDSTFHINGSVDLTIGGPGPGGPGVGGGIPII